MYYDGPIALNSKISLFPRILEQIVGHFFHYRRPFVQVACCSFRRHQEHQDAPHCLPGRRLSIHLEDYSISTVGIRWGILFGQNFLFHYHVLLKM